MFCCDGAEYRSRHFETAVARNQEWRSLRSQGKQDLDFHRASGGEDPHLGENYAVGYATSKSPLGPFKKAVENPILQKKGKISGTGHNSITYTPDGKEMLCVYHGRTEASGHDRLVFMDKMEVTKDGKLMVYGPTYGDPYIINDRNP